MKRLAVIIILIFMDTHVIGWGQTGHRTVGLIAENHLSKKAMRNIQKVLGNESIAMASNWMDEVRSDNSYNYMNPWHYCTIPDGKTYEEAGTPEEGDIIVIPFSDISWTPLFAKASAVISESGGVLSHCSIVAREYKIPAIVSVNNIMTTLSDNMQIAVDGFNGRVKILKN